MMKMKLLLFLCWVLRVSADDVLHVDLNVLGCSDSDGEFMYTLDGEEVWYADFKKGGPGDDPQPPFVDHVSVPGAYEQAVADLQVCRSDLALDRKELKDLPLEQDAPNSPVLYPKEEVELGQQNTLVCFVSGFYPAPVRVFWTKNGEKLTEGSSLNVPYPNKDGTWRQISRLPFTPQQGDMYGCSVEHPALTAPLTRTWEVEKSLPGVGPSVFCGVGLTVGLLGVAAGTFFLVKGNECS